MAISAITQLNKSDTDTVAMGVCHNGSSSEEASQTLEVLEDVRKMLDRPELMDVTFVCKNSEEVKANRAMMAGRCKAFSALLYDESDMKQSRTDRVPLPHVRGACLQSVIKYLYGYPFRLNGCWESLVEVYFLAKEFEVDSLCRQALSFVNTVVSPREIGELLNAAVPRQAEAVLQTALKVLNDKVIFDVSAFEGWSKESIKYCLDHVSFDPTVTETLLARAIIFAATLPAVSDSSVGGEADDAVLTQSICEDCVGTVSLGQSVEESASTVLVGDSTEESTDTGDSLKESTTGSAVLVGDSPTEEVVTILASSTDPDLNSVKNSEVNKARLLRIPKEDLADIFSHVRLELVDPQFILDSIEPLGVLPKDMLLAAYRTHTVRSCCAQRAQTSWYYATPWRSIFRGGLSTAVEGVKPFHVRKSVPSVWDRETAPNGMILSEEHPYRASCTRDGKRVGAKMCLPLSRGKHIWRVHVLNTCSCHYIWVGVADSSITAENWFGRQKGGYVYPSNGVITGWNDYVNRPRAPPSKIVFDAPGQTVIVILDMKKRTLTFAKEMADVSSQDWIAFPNLPSDSELYPAVSMRAPGCVEIEWIESSY